MPRKNHSRERGIEPPSSYQIRRSPTGIAKGFDAQLTGASAKCQLGLRTQIARRSEWQVFYRSDCFFSGHACCCIPCRGAEKLHTRATISVR